MGIAGTGDGVIGFISYDFRARRIIKTVLSFGFLSFGFSAF
tara:strand:+ start:1171 stop:1293 length:123 start_codon:yes stop_codon:yes gene_type:complete